jgi:hypothetical protein
MTFFAHDDECPDCTGSGWKCSKCNGTGKAPAATAPPSEQAAPVEAPTGEKVCETCGGTRTVWHDPPWPVGASGNSVAGWEGPCPKCSSEFTKGAVSVVKPQGTEETGADRPAAPTSHVTVKHSRMDEICPHGYRLANLYDGTDTCEGCAAEARAPSGGVDSVAGATREGGEFTLNEMLEWVSNTHASVAGYYFSNMRNGKGIKDQIAKCLRALRTDTAPTAPCGVTEDELRALENGASKLVHVAEYECQDEETSAEYRQNAATIRSLAARLSKGERG